MYSETRIRTKTLDIMLNNRYRKTGIKAKILDIIPKKIPAISQITFGYYSRICFRYYSFRYYSALPFDLILDIHHMNMSFLNLKEFLFRNVLMSAEPLLARDGRHGIAMAIDGSSGNVMTIGELHWNLSTGA